MLPAKRPAEKTSVLIQNIRRQPVLIIDEAQRSQAVRAALWSISGGSMAIRRLRRGGSVMIARRGPDFCALGVGSTCCSGLDILSTNEAVGDGGCDTGEA